MKEKENQQVVSLQVTDGLTVAVIQDTSHEFLMPTKDVALGYGVSPETIRFHRSGHKDELKEGVHFLSSVENTNGRGNLQTKQTFWTKAGVVRLGFFIKSDRAKVFRDWAEALVLKVISPAAPALPAAVKRKHNRLDAARLLRVMSLVAQVTDKNLRMALVRELMPDNLELCSPLQAPQIEKATKGGATC